VNSDGETPPNWALHLTGAAILVSRGIKLLQAAPAGELGRSAAKVPQYATRSRCADGKMREGARPLSLKVWTPTRFTPCVMARVGGSDHHERQGHGRGGRGERVPNRVRPSVARSGGRG
jgi:hypothetical protein